MSKENRFERAACCTTDVQEACQIGYAAGYEAAKHEDDCKDCFGAAADMMNGRYVNQREVLEAAIAKYGIDMQLNVAIEEMSELTKEICKFKRGVVHPDTIAEEMADVEIMIEQMNMIFDNAHEVAEIRDKKIRRLAERLKE